LRKRKPEAIVSRGLSVDLAGKVAVVTGASRGLGAGFAEGLAASGAAVALVARNLERLNVVARRISDNGGRAKGYETDVRSRDDVNAMVRRVHDDLGPIDILINNAGISNHAPAVETKPEEWLDTFDVNLNGLWWCSQAIAASMIERSEGGCIVNIGSISGLIVNRPFMQPAYNASKAAINHLTRSLAAEWAKFGIRVNCVAPGFVMTEMTELAVAEYAGEPDFKRYTMDEVPMKRFATIDEIVPTILYLASDECSRYVTGAVIVVDGGYTLW
jgi:NAD(P)-dependent dehydrogenase (short-subunit alcohol dehydrogenase family)